MEKITSKNMRPIDIRLSRIGVKLPNFFIQQLDELRDNQGCSTTLLIYNLVHAIIAGDIMIDVPKELEDVRITEKKLEQSMDMFRLKMYDKNGNQINTTEIEK